MLYLIIPLVTHIDESFLRKKFQKFIITSGVISKLLRYVLVGEFIPVPCYSIEEKFVFYIDKMTKVITSL